MIKGKNVLVTGAGGFIGSHLTEGLLKAGASVSGFVRYQSQGKAGMLDSLQANGLRVVRGDLADFESVSRAVAGQDIVLHLGALISIPYSYENPHHTFEVNAGGTLNVLQAAREHRTSRVVVMSTSEVYGTARYVPIDENHPLQAQSPYSASKIAAEKLAESFFKSFNLPVVVVRAFNTYGPRQSSRAVIPTIITQALRGEEIHLGSTTPTRDFNYVEDTVAGLIRAAIADAAVGEVMNLATGNEISIGDLTNSIVKVIGRRVTVHTESQRLRPEKSEVQRLLGASDKARRLLEWQPVVSLEEGLRRTVESIRAALDGYPEGYQI
jgi:dTDP-glucose 4,6-dehydratase